MKTRGEEKMKTLGNKIAELRKVKQMTQEDLAAQFNVSSQAVSKWENDLSIPDVTLLIQIADFFEVSLDDLLRQQETKKVVDASSKKASSVHNRSSVKSKTSARFVPSVPVASSSVAKTPQMEV